MNSKPDLGFYANVPEIIARHRILYIVILLAATLAVVAGIPGMNIDMSTESFFLENDPVKVTYQRFREYFGSDEFIFIVYRAKDGDVFSEHAIAALDVIHRKLEALAADHGSDPASPFARITDVTSLINVSYLEVAADTLRSREFIAGRPPTTDADRSELKIQARNHPNYIPSILNRKGDFGVIIIDTNLGAATAAAASDVGALIADDAFEKTGPAESGAVEFIRPNLWDYQVLTDALQTVLDESPSGQTLQFYPVGNPVVMKFFADIFIKEVSFLSLAALGFIMLTFYLLFRSLRAVLSAVAIVTTAIIWTLGVCGWVGASMTLMITIIIFLTLTVGVADAVHLLSGYLYLRQEGLDRQRAMAEVFRTSGPACFLTSLTTMIGLLALLVVPVVPLKIFGVFSGMGVFLAFVFTLVILPLTMPRGLGSNHRGPKRHQYHLVQRLIRRVEPLVYKAPWTVSLGFIGAAIFFAWGVTLIQVDTNMGQLISTRNAIRQNMDTVEANIGGTMDMEILVETGDMDGLKSPRVLAAMDALQTYLEADQGHLVVSTYSLANAVKESYQALNEDRREMYVIPATRPMLAQALLLFEGAAPEDRVKLVTDDYANARISVRIRNRGSFEYIPFMGAVQAKIDEIVVPLQSAHPNLQVQITGVFALFMKLSDVVSWSQIKSFSLALGVISILFIFVFRSVKGGLISIVPNLFPILVAFGTMGFMGFALDLDTLLVAPIAIGIAVDDTVHFLSRYRMESLAGAPPKLAVKHTFREVGQAMVFTSLILSAGFLMFTFSQHNGLSHFGLLSATAIVSAVISDLFFLPRLCILTDLKFGSGKRKPDPGTESR